MINVTQKQKEILNARGIEVIEYKRSVMKLQKGLNECVKRAIESMKSVAEAIKKWLESKRVSAGDKYKLCKSLGIDYHPYIKRNHIYRCRNNC